MKHSFLSKLAFILSISPLIISILVSIIYLNSFNFAGILWFITILCLIFSPLLEIPSLIIAIKNLDRDKRSKINYITIIISSVILLISFLLIS